MNNDKLLIIVLVLTLYLTCFRRSEGQETGEYICKYNEGDLDSVIRGVVANMFGSDVDDSGNFSTGLTLNQKIVLNNGLDVKITDDNANYPNFQLTRTDDPAIYGRFSLANNDSIYIRKGDKDGANQKIVMAH